MAKWKHLASAPCRHQRLPASILKPPRLPLAEDTSACGKAEGSGAYRTGGGGGESLLPHPLPGRPHGNAERRTTQFSTRAFIGGKVICTQVWRAEVVRLSRGGTGNPGPALLPVQPSCLEAQPEHAAADPVVVWELLDGACGERVGRQGGVPGLYRDTWPYAAPEAELPRAAQDRL